MPVIHLVSNFTTKRVLNNKKFWEELIACFPLIDMDHTANEKKKTNWGDAQRGHADRRTDTEQGERTLKPLSIFQNKESRLKTRIWTRQGTLIK
jgi:hypothetical protein